MKKAEYILLVIVLFLTTSCATLSRQNTVVERDNFLDKLPMFNTEILGELKYDDPDLDLNTLELKEYSELFSSIDITEDYARIIKFIQDNATDDKFIVTHDTFIICLSANNFILMLCDDAETPELDKVYTDAPMPEFENFSASFISNQSK